MCRLPPALTTMLSRAAPVVAGWLFQVIPVSVQTLPEAPSTRWALIVPLATEGPLEVRVVAALTMLALDGIEVRSQLMKAKRSDAPNFTSHGTPPAT